MPILNWIHQLLRSTRISLAVLAAITFSSTAIAHSESPSCPAEPVPPTEEQFQSLIKASEDHGFLWKIEKDGRTGYLYGTIHFNKRDRMFPGPKTIAAMRVSDVFAFELDVLDPQVQAQMTDPSKFGIKNFPLPPPLNKRLEAIGRRVCAPVAAFAQMHPMMQLVIVTLLDARFADAEAAYGSDIILASMAKGVGKPIVGLETVAQQMLALMGGEQKETIDLIESSVAVFETGKQRDGVKRLMDVWAKGDLADLEQYELWCDCTTTKTEREFYKRLNDDRNTGLAAGIDKLHRAGKPVFAAIGSLHMVGPKAVPKLLREMGYKVARVTF